MLWNATHSVIIRIEKPSYKERKERASSNCLIDLELDGSEIVV